MPYQIPPSAIKYQGPGRLAKTKGRWGMSYTKTGTKKLKRRKGAVRTFRQRVLNVAPAQHAVLQMDPLLLSNVIYTANVTALVTQGDSIGSRMGDGINLEALKLKGHLFSAAASNAYVYRIMVGYSGEEYASTTLVNTPSLSQAELFLGTPTLNTQGIINPKAFTCLYDESFDINSQVDDAKTSATFDVTIPLKKKFVYQANASIYGKDKNLYIVVIGVGADQSSATTIGQLTMQYDLIFKA